MTAPQARQPQVFFRPACTPAAIRAVTNRGRIRPLEALQPGAARSAAGGFRLTGTPG
jgi:hypothetical protein